MQPRKLSFHIACLLLFFLAIPGAVAYAQESEERYFTQTGHFVSGAFLAFFNETPENLRLFGYPITEAIPDSDGHLVQYFQRVRLDQLVDGSIQVAPLGRLLYEPDAPLAPVSTASSMCRRFPETGYSVCYAFLQFYDAYNGPKYFGNPISELEERDGGRFVQYFENVRMEWLPTAAEGEKVVLTHLGRMYFDEHVNDPALIRSTNPGNAIIALPQELQASAFVKDTLLPLNSTQSVFIVVQDAQFLPIQGANLQVVLTFPDGAQQSFRPELSNQNGISELRFPIPNTYQVDDVVKISVEAEYQGGKAQATTWFRIWW